MTAEANSVADAAGSQTKIGQDSVDSFQRDKLADSTYGQDTGTDERYEVESADRSTMGWLNGKYTYDAFQAANMQAMLSNQQNLNYQTTQRDRHTELAFQDERSRKNELHQQTMRHYEDMHSLRFNTAHGVWSDVVRDMAKDVQQIKAAVCK